MTDDRDVKIDPAIPKAPEGEVNPNSESESRSDKINPAIPKPPAPETNREDKPPA